MSKSSNAVDREMQKMRDMGVTISVSRATGGPTDGRLVDVIADAARRAGILEGDSMYPVVTVYSKPACQACTATKRYLTERGIPFTEDDITEPANLAAAKALGHLEAPVVVVATEGAQDSHWSGFRPDLLATITVAA